MNCKVSIIVPAYNMEARLPRCLDSLLAQTLPDCQIVLVNDGSTDRTAEIGRDYAAKHSRILFIDGQNEGVSSARNRGLDAAEGEFVGFCDSDDYVDPEMYEILSRAMEDNNADLASCALRAGKNLDEIRVNNPEIQDGVFDRPVILRELFIPLLRLRNEWNVYGYTCLCLFRNSILREHKIRFNPEISVHEDALFLLEYLAYTSKLAAVPEPYYNYIYYEKSLCAKYLQKKEVDLAIVEKERYLRNREMTRIVESADLPEEFADVSDNLKLNTLFHHCRMLTAARGLSFHAKLSGISGAVKQERVDSPRLFSRGRKVFHLASRFGAIPVYLICRILNYAEMRQK